MMRKSPARWMLVLALLACACMTPTQRREDQLIQDARTWNDDFRWARWDVVGQSMTPEENTLFQERRDLIGKDLVIADYEVTSVHFLPGSRAATVDVTLQWYKKNDLIVREGTLRQRWEERAGRWLMISQRRIHGDRFPLVPEPAEAQPAEAKPAAAAGASPTPR